MKDKTLEKAYIKLTKKKYTTRADLARKCDFSLMSASIAARELISLGLIFEKKIGNVRKLSAYDINYCLVEADINTLTLITFDKALKTISTETAIRNYSFPLVEDISLFLNGRYSPDPLFPCLFLIGVDENEANIFSDLLPKEFHIIPSNCNDPSRYMRENMFNSKIAQKALANELKV